MKTLGSSITNDTLKSKLKDFFNEEICKYEFQDEFQIVISSFGHDTIILNAKAMKENRDYYRNENSSIILDPGFKDTLKYLKGERIDKRSRAAQELELFSKNSLMSAEDKYSELTTYNQKKEFAKLHIPSYHPDREYFLHDNETVSAKNCEIQLEPKEGWEDWEIQIMDSTSYIIHGENGRYMDSINSGIVRNKKWYPNGEIINLVKAHKKSCDIVVSYGNGKYEYFKQKLKPGVDLKDHKYLKVENAHLKKFTLTTENGVFVLKDSNGTVDISVGDLHFMAFYDDRLDLED